MKPIKSVVAFCRLSNGPPADGKSLEAQRKTIELHCSRNGWKVLRVFCVAGSTRSHEVRKVFNEMLAYTEQHAGQVDGIFFKSVDRATRNAEGFAPLEALWNKHQIDVIFVDGDLRMSRAINLGVQP